jgi:hypothetical protein
LHPTFGIVDRNEGERKMKRTHEFYEVRSLDDNHGLSIRNNESAEKALEEINDAYEYAKTRGFDNRDEKWIIVCNQIVKEFDDKGRFLKEERSRFVVENVEWSDYEKAFVFVY